MGEDMAQIRKKPTKTCQPIIITVPEQRQKTWIKDWKDLNISKRRCKINYNYKCKNNWLKSSKT
ncbi:hypothetical protein EPI10_006199 [Gossypium australe]|uniref:Uncharacterized protein n=1 Tax=Gossypium australe TaxID=47621 RepID=A0A5B6WQC5_9ROSI|nr:hypothetical protein EPI10_006199 [Gossypium australe]